MPRLVARVARILVIVSLLVGMLAPFGVTATRAMPFVSPSPMDVSGDRSPSTSVEIDSASNSDNTVVVTSGCDAFEPNDAGVGARVFPIGDEETHAFCTASDSDWVKASFTSGNRYEIGTYLLAPGVDTAFIIWQANASGGYDNRGGNANIGGDDEPLSSAASFRPTVSDTYYIEVFPESGSTFGADAAYTLYIGEYLPCVDDAVEPNDWEDEATPFSIGSTGQYAFCASEGFEDHADTFSVELAAGVPYTFETFELAAGVNTIISLMTLDEAQSTPDETIYVGIGFNDNRTKLDQSSKLTMSVPAAGTYFIRVD